MQTRSTAHLRVEEMVRMSPRLGIAFPLGFALVLVALHADVVSGAHRLDS